MEREVGAERLPEKSIRRRRFLVRKVKVSD